MKNSVKLFLPLIVLSLVVAGCGAGKTKGPDTVKVSGTLNIGGKPAPENILVTLSPDGDGLQAASGKTDSSGKFSLTTGQTGTPGAMPGKYKVVLTKLEGGMGDDDEPDYMKGDNMGESGDGSDVSKDVGPFPERFSTFETSDQPIEITAANSNLVIDIPGE